MHKLALLFVHFCCLLSRISIPSVKRRCNLSHLSLFHKYIEIMKGFYIVRTLSFISISSLLFLYVSVFLPVVVSAFLHRSSPPYYHCRYAETYTTNHSAFYFSLYVIIRISRYFKMQLTFSQYRILLKRRSTCRLETLMSHIAQNTTS